ncbi:helix-turn-helix domain-containing protein [Desulfitibacter alkalitolerans]|uniref:helix-turn-helix domain-containing protein n=1 Tax=Desulfitibacter alkalitolerans TaxID=264641 RepID=UPI0004876975|nr:helix-turn-helix transcriptional regulator [Desulfitibacter alkalitolerans]
MKTENIKFGDFIKAKRMEKEITLRALADVLKVSPAYLSDIENNRRYPMDNSKIEILIEELRISPEEQEILYDLAGKARNEVSPDLLEYTMDSEVSNYVRAALRKAKKNDATIDDWKKIIEEFDQKGKD